MVTDRFTSTISAGVRVEGTFSTTCRITETKETPTTVFPVRTELPTSEQG